jgi:hypothetical protein
LVADEAQDYLNNENFMAIFELINGGFDNGRYRIFYDASQDLKGSIDYEFFEEIMKKDDVIPYHLKYNYRNTRNIINYAYLITLRNAGEIKNNPEGSVPDFQSIPYLDIKSHKVDWRKYAKELSNKINNLLDEGFTAKDILIITVQARNKSIISERDIELIRIKNGIKLIHCTDVDFAIDINAQGIQYGSVYELKGMDAKVAIVVDLFEFDNDAQALVAITRGRSQVIMYLGDTYKDRLSTHLSRLTKHSKS